jgi:ABC-type bacteriocin/lantibiotic exporter with double-glycine peptidase domain
MTRYTVLLDNKKIFGGLACLATVAKHHRCNFPCDRIKTVMLASQKETPLEKEISLKALKYGAEVMKFNARACQASLEASEQFYNSLYPAIILFDDYWVVLYGKQKDKYVIADPGQGIRYLSEQELLEHWTGGYMLALSPKKTFWKDKLFIFLVITAGVIFLAIVLLIFH